MAGSIIAANLRDKLLGVKLDYTVTYAYDTFDRAGPAMGSTLALGTGGALAWQTPVVGDYAATRLSGSTWAVNDVVTKNCRAYIPHSGTKLAVAANAALNDLNAKPAEIGVTVRRGALAPSGYTFGLRKDASGVTTAALWQGGVPTASALFSVPFDWSPFTVYTLGVKVVDNVMLCYVNNELVGSAYHATETGTAVGIHTLSSVAGTAAIDQFLVADLAALDTAGLNNELANVFKQAAFEYMFNTCSISVKQLTDDGTARDALWNSSVAMPLVGPQFLESLGTVAFVFGGTTGSGVATTESYVFVSPGTKGVTPAELSGGRDSVSAVGNSANAFVFGGNDTLGDGLTTVENYAFSTPSTKGTTPSVLSSARSETSAAGNETDAFVFGGFVGGTSRTNLVENYVFATPATKGSSPAVLTAIRRGTAAASNATNAFVFGGLETAVVTTVENYLFATPTSKGTTPAVLSSARRTTSAAANATNTFVFGGFTTVAVSTVENYLFATPATKGVAPASLSAINYGSAAASSATNAFVFGGRDTARYSTVENYVFSASATKGTAPAALSSLRSALGAASNRNFL